MLTEAPFYIPQFLWKFWLSGIDPTKPCTSRIHVYDNYKNELTEITGVPPSSTQPFSGFDDGRLDRLTRAALETADRTFQHLEGEAESTLRDLLERVHVDGPPSRAMSFTCDRRSVERLRTFLLFLRFRNSAIYKSLTNGLKALDAEDKNGTIYSAYQPFIAQLHKRMVLRSFTVFLQEPTVFGPKVSSHSTENNRSNADHLLASFESAMNEYCWHLSNAEMCIGIAADDQEFILSNACFGTLQEALDEEQSCSDIFFPISPNSALYILGYDNDEPNSRLSSQRSYVHVEVGLESVTDVHLRNAMILQTHPQYLYFSSLRPISLSISSYDEFRWTKEHPDYTRLKQRCRQKFLQETVTKTLVIKGSLVMTDLTDEVVYADDSAVCYGSFADVWKGTWNDPVERRPRTIAVKVLRQVLVGNVREKLMKRLQAEIVVWHKLCHRNVNLLFGVVQFQTSIGMVSLWCENGTICHYLRVRPDADRLNLLVQIASGISYLHSFQPTIVHGDLKGGNILVDAQGCPIITDFGLSKIMEDMSETIHIGSSFFAGSTRWMAPELILALVEDDGRIPPITTRSDVYAFASVCLEVVSGQLPYPHRTNDHAVTLDIVRGVKPSRGVTLRGVQLRDESAFWALLDRCWNEAPFLRPGMEELAGALAKMA